MGWHGNSLVLSVNAACTFEPLPGPVAWHVADSATAGRTANITNANCTLRWWPSPAGIAYVDTTGSRARLYDWSGNVTATVATQADDYFG